MSDLCPAEIMAKAAFEFGSNGMLWVAYKNACPNIARYKIKRQRAALRVLAEMEPTEAMVDAATEGLIAARKFETARETDAIAIAQSVMRVAAGEGEK